MRDADLADPLRSAVDGDEAGFAVLWRALQPAVLRYLHAVCGDAAEDVASETWLQVARDLPAFTGDATAFRVWLFRIARNRGIDDGRRVWRRREESRDSIETADARAVPDVTGEVLEHAGTAWALRLIGELPPDQAEAVLLRVVAGLDVAGTAEVLGKRPGAVRVAAMRGLRRLAANPQVQSRREQAGSVEDPPGPAASAGRSAPTAASPRGVRPRQAAPGGASGRMSTAPGGASGQISGAPGGAGQVTSAPPAASTQVTPTGSTPARAAEAAPVLDKQAPRSRVQDAPRRASKTKEPPDRVVAGGVAAHPAERRLT